MSQKEIAAAARAICEEKGISLEAVVETIESALAAAYRKDYGEKNQNIKVEFDIEGGGSKVYDEKTVVEDMPEEEIEDGDDKKDEKKVESKKDDKNEESKESAQVLSDRQAGSDEAEEEEEERRFNPRTEIQISEAKKIKKSYKIGDIIRTDLETPEDYGRMAAQTAKQVIIQRLREVERTNLFDEFKDKEGEVIAGVVQRREGRIVLIDLGRVTGVIPPDGQVPGERYEPGQRIKVYVEAVNSTAKGPEIVLSRSSEEIVKKVFLVEIPEISNGLIDIKSVSREAGSRSKIAVLANEENVDPIGSCVGQRGARIQIIISELSGEKVDIIEYSDDPKEFISNSLAPAKILNIEVDENNKVATATVASDQLSLAIGKGGQNVRLAAKLTGWRIDIKEDAGSEKGEKEDKVEEEESKEDVKEEEKSEKKEVKEEVKDKKAKAKKEPKEKKEVKEKESSSAKATEDKEEIKEKKTTKKKKTTKEEDN